MRPRAPVLLLLVAAIGAAGTAAHAGKKPPPKPAADEVADKKARAQKLVTDGRAAFDKGAFADAAARFEEAYRQFPVPKMLYNIGITYDALKRDDKTVCALEGFLAGVPDADATLKKDSEDRLTRLRPGIGRITVDAPAGAVLFLDGEERATAPAKVPLCASSGAHRVVAVSAGSAPVGLDVTVRPAAALRVSLDPSSNSAKLISDSGAAAAAVAAAANPTPTEPVKGGPVDDTPVWKKGWFWGVVGVVAVGAAVGIVIGTRPVDTAPPQADFGPVMVFK